MGNEAGLRKGSWMVEEDNLLNDCIRKYGEGKWHLVPVRAGLNRCRKSCRLRWLNYLSPNIKRGNFSRDEVDLIKRMHKLLGNRWSLIAGRLPGRTANDIKNFWNTYISRTPLPRRAKTITKNNIVRPHPRTFLDLQRTSAPQKDGNPADKSDLQNTASPYVQEEQTEGDDKRIQWWTNLLAMNDDEGSGLGDPPVVSGAGEDKKTEVPIMSPDFGWLENVENDQNGCIDGLSLDDGDFWDL